MENIHPLPEQMEAFTRDLDDEGPIVMLNLLKYRKHAKYKKNDQGDACSGREAYQRYGKAAREHLQAAGARLIWMGSVKGVLIGPLAEAWDDVLLVEYPSKKAFMDMAFSKEYLPAAAHRTAALEDSRLIALKTAVDALIKI